MPPGEGAADRVGLPLLDPSRRREFPATAIDPALQLTARYRTIFRLPWSSPMKTASIKTNRGEIRVQLFDDKAPKTVANFEKLVNQAFTTG